MSNKFLKNKSDESAGKSLEATNIDSSKPLLEGDDNPGLIESFEKALPFTAPTLFDPNIWSNAFLEWVKKFNQEEFAKNSREDNTESET